MTIDEMIKALEKIKEKSGEKAQVNLYVYVDPSEYGFYETDVKKIYLDEIMNEIVIEAEDINL